MFLVYDVALQYIIRILGNRVQQTASSLASIVDDVFPMHVAERLEQVRLASS